MHILIPVDQWEKCGSEEDPASRLLTTIYINGISMHLEAIAIEDHFNSHIPVTAFQEEYEAYYRAAGADGEFTPVTIAGRQYVLFASPFCM